MTENQHIIVGTAGHVDHGKTELTAVLTGINTDRLPEEKKRGMTIVPGFVPLLLPNGIRLGLIDVPGHEKFVKNMLAGVAGIDMVMLVIAADEGVMPQTEEHLNILHLLGIEKGIAVITKADLVDEEWLELIKEQVSEVLAPTSLHDAPIIATSAYTGDGMEELRQQLMELTETVERKPLSGHARLPIDRVFSKTGFGTVITGTLWSGSLEKGQKVELWPAGREARIRSIQVHQDEVERAVAGQRTAVNLSGVDMTDSPRGGWLAEPGLLLDTYRIDVSLRSLGSIKALRQRARVRVHHGTTEALARVNLLDREELQAGGSCFCQLELENPLPPLVGDKLILRSYSPMFTIGGATVIDPNPQRHKRYHDDVIAALEAKTEGSNADLLAAIMTKEAKPLNLAAAAKAAQAPADETDPLLAELTEDGQLLSLQVDGEQVWLSMEAALEKLMAIKNLLEDYHQQYPLRLGFPLAELKTRYFTGFSQKQMNALLGFWQDKGELAQKVSTVSLSGYSPILTAKDKELIKEIDKTYTDELFTPPVWSDLLEAKQIAKDQAAEYLQYMIEQELLIKGGDYYFHATAPNLAWEKIKANEKEEGFSAGDIRKLLGSSRKYALALLEYMDARKLTIRVGDKRFCGEK